MAAVTMRSHPWRAMSHAQQWIRRVDEPRAIPRLAAHLLSDVMYPGGPVEQLEVRRALDVIDRAQEGLAPDVLVERVERAVRAGKQNVGWMRGVLTSGALWWCSAEMTDVVCEAAVDMPDDFVLSLDGVPHPTGLVVFGRPVVGVDAIVEGRQVTVDAIMWGPTLLPPRHDPEGLVGRDDPGVLDAISFTALRRFTGSDPDFVEAGALVPADGEVWVPLGRTDWPLGDPIGLPSHHGLDDRAWQSMREDRQLMAALWTIAATPTVVERGTVHASRPEARRIARLPKPPSTEVTVVHLRREVPTGAEAEVDETVVSSGRHLSVRFLVRAHLRWQACGPNRSERRLIVVPPHVRGPEGAPMVRRPRVWSLDR